ncbi:hypothetical protein NLI96_g3435 [Meripilus lineatus]|uniref:F-box domain-containing protein n=1 Tax=Meripilus lineatus TaxID=2056292 RepID=A0AAD5VC89_9APHY|nr:hypothetical protein NLI96_g3435 [Physisporinus lineatus]
MLPVRSPSCPSINTTPPQVDPNGAGVPLHQDPLHTMLARPDAFNASRQTSPSNDDLSSSSSLSPHSPLGLDVLRFWVLYPDFFQHHPDRRSQLAVMDLDVGPDAPEIFWPHWNTSTSNITLSRLHLSLPSSITFSQQTDPSSTDTLSEEEHLPMTLAIPDSLEPSLDVWAFDDNSPVLSSMSGRLTRHRYPRDHITWLAGATILPMELLLDILEYLARDVKFLLACALTCRRLRPLAQVMINKFRLFFIKINATRYDDLDELVEWLRPAPKLGRSIETFQVTGMSKESIPVVLSVLPIRLSSLLISLRELQFKHFAVESQPHLSRWSLYGRAFPNLTTLELFSIRFPSLKDFVALITSFPALTTLVLTFFELGSPLIPTEISNLGERYIQWFLAMIVPHAACSLKTMEVEVIPTSEDIESFAWRRLDVVLSSWFMVNQAKNNSKLTLFLDKTYLIDNDLSVESLFPLSTSLGKDRWVKFTRWQ